MEFTEQVIERFWNKVDKSGECWLWIGADNGNGYGKLTIDQGQIFAHRLSWILAYGPIPDGLCVLHKCDTPACVRPGHLFLGSKADNNRDMTAKGRNCWFFPEHHVRGERQGHAKLTSTQVQEIRQKYQPRIYSKYMLAREYGVAASTIWAIIHRRQWKHVA